jgi:acetylornithine deacetylase/succinyl-diaminopimelate desuccinylase-like protein
LDHCEHDLSAIRHARRHGRRAVGDLAAFLRYPSVSADPAYRGAASECAAWLASHLRTIGLEDVRMVTTPGAPVVVASNRHRHGRLHVLVYGHYDVQPVAPAAEWRTSPFRPTIVGDAIHARGASDDKGQLLAHVKAAEAILATEERLPVNLTVVAEGEEEVGSPNLAGALGACASHPDLIVASDSRMLGPTRPAITIGLRGSVGLEVTLRGPRHDLHSGAFGGAVVNPAHELADLVSSLHDGDGRVAVAGFYDGVRAIPASERARLVAVGPSDAALRAQADGAPLTGDRRFSAYERTVIRPAINITALSSGYEGPGARNAIPATATARLNARLVPGQVPAEIIGLMRSHVSRATRPGVVPSLRLLSAAPPTEIDPHEPALELAAQAYAAGFGARPALVRSGGSIPAVAVLQRTFDAPVVLMGFGLPDDNMHAPNERFRLPIFRRAIETCIWFLILAGRDQAPIASSVTKPRWSLPGMV